MRTSKYFADVTLKGNVGLVSTMNPETTDINVNKFAIDEKLPQAVNALKLAAIALSSIKEEPALAGQRVTLLIPDSISVRAYEALKHKAESAEEIASTLLKPWMTDGENAKAYVEAIGEFAVAFKAATEHANINIINSRTLYKFEIVGIGGVKENLQNLEGMTELALTNSVNEDLGVCVRQGEMSYCNVVYNLTKQNRGQNGQTYTHWYVTRTVGIIKADGSKERVPVGTAAAMEGIEGQNDSYATLINVAKFRAIAAANLPRTKVVKSFNVKVA